MNPSQTSSQMSGSKQLRNASVAVGVFAFASLFRFKRHMNPTLHANLFLNKDLSFRNQLFSLLKVALQRQDLYTLGLHSVFLVLRTWLSLVITQLDGKIVKSLVRGRLNEFLSSLFIWCTLAVPCSYTNSKIKFLQNKLSMGMRLNLTNYALKLYLDDNLAFYKVINMDNRIESIDQYLTTDIAKFCDAITSLYSNLCKPILDMILFNYQLKNTIGIIGTVGLSFNYVITAQVLRYISPSFGKLAAKQAHLEGAYRQAHTRLITNAEEICFYNGEEIEQTMLNKSYNQLQSHIHSILKFRMPYNMVEDIFVKYEWSAAALLVCGIPVFFKDFLGAGMANVGDDTGNASQQFVIAKRLMLSLGDAGGRIMYAYKDMLEVTGYLQRIFTSFHVLHQLHENVYVAEPKKYSMTSVNGTINYIDDGFVFKNADICIPSANGGQGEVIVKQLDMTIKPGQHTLITGPNGSGKTSIVRVIRGLWPLFEGEMNRPQRNEIMYIPQRAYLSIGSLRDQLIYPHTYAEMIKNGKSDDDLQIILDIVHLGYLEAREGGFDTVKDWKDVFSGGEKQRVNICRLFYHKPKYVIL